MNAQATTLAQEQGRALYHSIWLCLRNQFWDPNRLVWAEWEHRFDDAIVSIATAKEKARELIVALNDNYTKLLEKGTVANDTNRLVSSVVLANNIGYLCIASFASPAIFGQVSEELTKVAHCDGLIVDLSGNPGGFLTPTANCLELFIEKGPIATVEEQGPDGVTKNYIYFPDDETFFRLTEKPDGTTKSVPADRAACMTKGKPMVLLVDGGTASSAELFAAALLANGQEDGSCIAMGIQTFGKGIIQDTEDFDQCLLKFTSGRYLSPSDEWFGDGAQTVSNGLRPTIRVNTKSHKVLIRAAFEHLCQKLGKKTERATSHQGGGLLGIALGAAVLFSLGVAVAAARRG